MVPSGCVCVLRYLTTSSPLYGRLVQGRVADSSQDHPRSSLDWRKEKRKGLCPRWLAAWDSQHYLHRGDETQEGVGLCLSTADREGGKAEGPVFHVWPRNYRENSLLTGPHRTDDGHVRGDL